MQSTNDPVGKKPLSISSAEDRARISRVVFAVHGIRDFGEWREELRRELGKQGIELVKVTYGYFDLLRFLFPFALFRRAVIAKVARQVRSAQRAFPNARFSYIAHSFGTYVVANMLLDDPWFQADRIIFCGSVLKYDCPLSQLRSSYEPPLLNEVGSSDLWPSVAASVTWGYGAAGSLGFNQPNVYDRWHKGGHGLFLTAAFARRFWLPFLLDGTVVESDNTPDRPSFLVRLLRIVSIKYSLAAVITVVMAYLQWQQPFTPCYEKWLNKDQFDQCFQEATEELANVNLGQRKYPATVQGQLSYLGLGSPEYKAHWVAQPTRFSDFCWDMRTALSRPDFNAWNRRAAQADFDLIYMQSFVDQDRIEQVQASWAFVGEWPKGKECKIE
ncbi:hypothetical protein NKH94_14895 [Mesorhizobium australicum]|uniref:hypothetical protein n=1 Tax=Mesorhizobium australicum TaxID=536018 RepID=UPI00333CB95D